MKLSTFAAVLVLIAPPASAREISSAEAVKATAAWSRRAIEGVSTTADEDGTPVFHVVRLNDGGTVVTSSESGVTPIVAFFDDGDVPDGDNPIWKILRADMAERMERVRTVHTVEETLSATLLRSVVVNGGAFGERPQPFAAAEAAWAKLLAAEVKPADKRTGLLKAAGITDASGLTDPRVAPLVSTVWHQEGNAANYYTPPGVAGDPNNYPCGCVALAGAEIANYWRFPTEPMPPVTNLCCADGVAANYVSLGGTYDWDNMPMYYYSLTTIQKRAVGRLCYDFGVATYMEWDRNGSGTAGTLLGDAFRDVFGYASAIAYFHDNNSVMPGDLVEKTILANLDAKCPVAVSLYGHVAVADGYGYASGTLYTHLNLGWGGAGNAWYNLPEVEVDEFGVSYSSSVLGAVVYNIFPTATGELLTGRVFDGDGEPVEGAEVTAFGNASSASGTTDERGIYALRVADGRRWTVVATAGNLSGCTSVFVGSSVSAVCEKGVGGALIIDSGTVGNSWGNDITLGSGNDLIFVDAAQGNDANDGHSWASAKASIQSAIDTASAGVLVIVNDGRYEPISTDNKAISICSVNGPGATFIDGSLQWESGVTNRCATLGTAVSHTNSLISGFCLTNGIAIGVNGGGSYAGTLENCVLAGNAARNGGGAWNGKLVNCTIAGNGCNYQYGYGGGCYDGTLVNCTISGNTSPYYGGGTAYSTLINCTISGNTAKNGGGAANSKLTSCTITNNTATTYGGGAYQGSLTGCTLADNTASQGGGFNGGYGDSGAMTNCTLASNTASLYGGGACNGTLVSCILNGNRSNNQGGGSYKGILSGCVLRGNAASFGGGSCDGTLTQCTITNNVATSGGGAYNGTLRFCTVSGNSADSGGGAYGATLNDCTISRNTAGVSGGGIYGSLNSGVANGCVIMLNSAQNGGGVYGATLNSCIVWNNTATNGGGAYNGTLNNCTVSGNEAAASGGGTYFTKLNNDIVWGNAAASHPAHYGALCQYSCLDGELRAADDGGNNIVTNAPGFADATRGNFQLVADSPCINAGSNEFATTEADFYGDARIVGGRVDMGASEFQRLLTGYAVWAAENGVTGTWNTRDTLGIHNVLRYVFNIPTGAFENPPLLSISIAADGNAVIQTPRIVNSEGFDISILATDGLDGSGAVTYSLDPDGETVIPASGKKVRFFRLKAEEK
ncbi:MAG: C10 family peptidase [Kiritimatiellae bacterium]|nr:C10 family peptidase [Kiritimatiellia bacterium]